MSWCKIKYSWNTKIVWVAAILRRDSESIQGFHLILCFFSRILEILPTLLHQHSAAIGCTKKYQPIGVTVLSHCVEIFEGLHSDVGEGGVGVNCEKPRCKDGCHPQNVSKFFLSATIWQVNFSYWAHAAGRYIVGSQILVLRTCFANLCRGSVIYLMNAVVSLVGLERTARSVWRPSPASTEHVRNPLNATATKAFSEPIATVPCQL